MQDYMFRSKNNATGKTNYLGFSLANDSAAFRMRGILARRATQQGLNFTYSFWKAETAEDRLEVEANHADAPARDSNGRFASKG